MTEILCVVCQQRRPQWPMTCESCRRRIREQLTELAHQYACLDATPVTSSAGPRVSGTRTPPLPGRLDVLNLVGRGARRVHVNLGEVEESDVHPAALADRPLWEQQQRAAATDQIGEVPPLLWLDGWVRDWRDTLDPDHHLPPARLMDMVRWLDHRLDAAMDSHPAIDQFAAELGEQVAVLRSANGDRSDWRRIGTCPERQADGQPCGTPLYANPWVDAVQCRACLTRWDRREWRFLGAVLRDTEHGGAA